MGNVLWVTWIQKQKICLECHWRTQNLWWKETSPLVCSLLFAVSSQIVLLWIMLNGDTKIQETVAFPNYDKEVTVRLVNPSWTLLLSQTNYFIMLFLLWQWNMWANTIIPDHDCLYFSIVFTASTAVFFCINNNKSPYWDVTDLTDNTQGNRRSFRKYQTMIMNI